MGLRKIIQAEKVSYLYASATFEELRIMVLQKDVAHSMKLTAESDAVQRWCRNLEKTPLEYLSLVGQAVDNLSSVCDNGKNMKEDIFEIQDDHLVWKQYFPEKKVYGRRGKFLLEMMGRDSALDEIMNSIMGEFASNAKTIDQLTLDLQTKTKEVQKATDLVAKSVKMKEDFEKEIYGKCAAIINKKKLRMRQIISNPPSAKGDANNKTIIESNDTVDSNTANKMNNSDSECYNSDTDVDDPDQEGMDTDEENLQSLSPKKTQTKKVESVKRVIDSQDDLFNNSIDAELYPPTLTEKRRKTTKSKTNISATDESQSNFIRGKGTSRRSQEGKASQPSPSFQSDTQNSILDELF